MQQAQPFAFQAIDSFHLERLPRSQDKSLRAWDAGDEYVLAQLQETQVLPSDANILLLNDQFGALAAALHRYQLSSWTDSYVSQQACKLNFEANQLADEMPNFIAATDLAEFESSLAQPDLIIIKVPHNVSLLEQQLHSIRALLTPNTLIIAAGMVKQIHNSTLKLFTEIIGPTTTSLAKKKSRLILPQLDPDLTLKPCPYPSSYYQSELSLELAHHANVFSRQSLDIGARAFLACFDQLQGMQAKVKNMADLGCGNGVLGIMARRYLPEAKIDFYDESFAAVASAKLNYNAAYEQGSEAKVDFIWANCFPVQTQNQYDLVLCNPPFHQQRVVGDFIAWPMIKQSYKALHTGGELWLVGNRHLEYHKKLKRVFGNFQTLHRDNKFVVLKAVKTAH